MPHTALPKRPVQRTGAQPKTGRFEAGERPHKRTVRQLPAVLRLRKAQGREN
ncbi:MAG: hypothetical protein RLZZ67_592 [Candidatus Parcubacteria bacterium]